MTQTTTILAKKEGGKSWLLYETNEGLAVDFEGRSYYHMSDAPNTQGDYISLKNILLKIPS